MSGMLPGQAVDLGSTGLLAEPFHEDIEDNEDTLDDVETEEGDNIQQSESDDQNQDVNEEEITDGSWEDKFNKEKTARIQAEKNESMWQRKRDVDLNEIRNLQDNFSQLQEQLTQSDGSDDILKGRQPEDLAELKDIQEAMQKQKPSEVKTGTSQSMVEREVIEENDWLNLQADLPEVNKYLAEHPEIRTQEWEYSFVVQGQNWPNGSLRQDQRAMYRDVKLRIKHEKENASLLVENKKLKGITSPENRHQMPLTGNSGTNRGSNKKQAVTKFGDALNQTLKRMGRTI